VERGQEELPESWGKGVKTSPTPPGRKSACEDQGVFGAIVWPSSGKLRGIISQYPTGGKMENFSVKTKSASKVPIQLGRFRATLEIEKTSFR